MNEDLEKLEIRLSYLEKENAELNEAVLESDRTISELLKRIEKLESNVADLIEESGESRPNRRPPLRTR